LNYCATILAESANAMIVRYLPGQVVSLADIRMSVTRASQVKSRGTEMAIEPQFRLIHPIESEYGLKLQTAEARLNIHRHARMQLLLLTSPGLSNGTGDIENLFNIWKFRRGRWQVLKAL
jgi:hypothetical protein